MVGGCGGGKSRTKVRKVEKEVLGVVRPQRRPAVFQVPLGLGV